MKKTNPVDLVIGLFGGTNATARAIGVTPGAISHWRKRGGNIPGSSIRIILKAAAKLGLRVTANELLVGRVVSK